MTTLQTIFANITQEQALWMLTGLVIPLVVALVTKVSTPSWVKGLLATVLSALDGAIVAYYTVGLTASTWMIFFITAVGISQTFYGQFFKPIGWTDFFMENIGPKDPKVLPGEVDVVDELG